MDLHLRAAVAVRPFASGTSRGVLLLASLLLLTGLLPGAASAAPERGALVVEGLGGTTTEWVLKEPATVTRPLPELTGGGDYAGVLIEAVEPRGGETGQIGALRIRAFRDRTKDAVTTLGIDGSLEPGRYRVRLFGEGAVRARWELGNDHPGLQVAPTTRMSVTFLGRAEPLPEGEGGARVDLPGSLPAGKRVLMATLLDGTAVEDPRMCATTEQSCPGNPPICPRAGLPCDVGLPSVGNGDPRIWARVLRADTVKRALRWSVDGHRLEADRLRAAALIF